MMWCDESTGTEQQSIAARLGVSVARVIPFLSASMRSTFSTTRSVTRETEVVIRPGQSLCRWQLRAHICTSSSQLCRSCSGVGYTLGSYGRINLDLWHDTAEFPCTPPQMQYSNSSYVEDATICQISSSFQVSSAMPWPLSLTIRIPSLIMSLVVAIDLTYR